MTSLCSGESIPIRLFLAGYDLTPTMRDVCKRFSVRYYLNLVLVDEKDRRYFKQQEIVLWRKSELPPRAPLPAPPPGALPSAMQQYQPAGNDEQAATTATASSPVQTEQTQEAEVPPPNNNVEPQSANSPTPTSRPTSHC